LLNKSLQQDMYIQKKFNVIQIFKIQEDEKK